MIHSDEEAATNGDKENDQNEGEDFHDDEALWSERGSDVDDLGIGNKKTIQQIAEAVGCEDGKVASDNDFERSVSTDDERVRDDYREENDNKEIPGRQNLHRGEF